MQQVPTAHFDSGQFPPAERLEAWRRMTASLYQTWPRGDPREFRAVAHGYQVGELVFNQAEFSPARFRRGPDRLQQEGRDFLSLQAQLAGEERLIMSHGQVRLVAGNIYLRDWGYAFDSEASAMRLNAVMIPRHRLRVGASMTAHNPVMSWSMAEPGGRLLSILWAELIAQLPEVTLAQARNLCDAFLGFLDALLGFGPDETRSASLGAMQQFLMARLQGNIGVEDLCRHFHVSRSTVYRLFKPLGGVRQYINSARLGRCYAELRQADPKRVKVSDVATSWHFDEASSFARLFRKMFGAPPSQILGTSFQDTETPDVSGELPRANLIRDYMEWLRQASGSDPPPLPHRRLG